MNKKYLLLLCLLFSSLTVQAALVSIGPDVTVESYSGATNVLIAMDTNPVTGEYVVCHAEEPVSIKCTRRDANNNGLSNVFLSTGTTGVNIDFQNLDVALNDAGQVYLMWTGEGVFKPGTVAFVQAFDSDGSDLFLQRETTNTGWTSASLALTPSSYWVGGTLLTLEFGLPSLEVVAEIYDSTGNNTRIIYPYSLITADPFTLVDCISASVASNRSGDVVMAWTQPTENSLLNIGRCGGTVYAVTSRENGVSISSVVQLSNTETDDMGNDVSPYVNPVATAYENGEYVIAWSDDSLTYSANLALNGDVATGQEFLILGQDPKIGGNSANQDYVVVSEIETGSGCALEARLAFDADITPSVTFSPGSCNHDSDINFLADGNMLLARTTTNNANGNVVVNRIGLPAEIEVSSVSVLEGNAGSGSTAAVEISLNRPHPAGDDIQVSYFTRDNTALLGIDYEFTQGSVSFTGGSGVLSQTVLVPIIGDSDFEDDEIFSFVLENPINAVLKTGSADANITIRDDDFTPDITADCTGGNANNCREIMEPVPGESIDVEITLTMAAPIASDITISYSTDDGTATAGSDYEPADGTLQLVAGSTEATFVLTILGDDINEDTETFTVTLSAGDSVSIPDRILTFSILNDTVCFIEVNPNAVVATAAGGTESFNVTTLPGCNWDVTTNVSWITLMPPTSNTGSGMVSFEVDAFDPPAGTFTRSGLVTVTLNDPLTTASADFIVDQDGDCSFTLDNSSMNFDAAGGTGGFTVTPNDESCDWDVTSPVDWITITSPLEPVMGSGSVTYEVNENTSGANVVNEIRMETLTSPEFDYTITQDGCSFDLASDSATVDFMGNSGLMAQILAPTAASGPCPWTAVSNATWILIAAGSSGTGGGLVFLDVLENPSIEPRTGTVSIGGQTFTVEQTGQACSYEVSPASFDVCPDGQTFDIAVTATDGCSWSLTPQQSWLQILNNASGLGSETAMGVVSPNLSEDSRSGSFDLLVTRFGASVAQSNFNQSGFLLYEDFGAGLPADWTFDPMVNWSVQGTTLFGNLFGVGGIGRAIDQTTACKDCKVETTMMVTTFSSGTRNSATLIGWYEDENNHVGLAMDEFTNRWILFQRVNGVTSESIANVDEIVPNVSYELAIRYDGNTFYGDIDGVNLLQLNRQPNTDPIGFAGFESNDNNASFVDLRITGTESNFEVLLDGGFEAFEPVVMSACSF